MAKKQTARKIDTKTRVSRKKTADDYKPDADVDFSKPAGFEQIDSGDIMKFDRIGDQLRGKFLGFDELKTQKGVSKLLIVQQSNGIKTKAFMSSHLKKCFGIDARNKITKETKIKVGMEVLIRLRDVRNIGSRQTYKVFEVFAK